MFKRYYFLLLPLFILLFGSVSFAVGESQENINGNGYAYVTTINYGSPEGTSYTATVYSNYKICLLNDGGLYLKYVCAGDLAENNRCGQLEFNSGSNTVSLMNNGSVGTCLALTSNNNGTPTWNWSGIIKPAFHETYNPDMPVFTTWDECLEYSTSGNEIEYEYDSNIGYLVGIKERAKILVVEDNAVANSGSSRIFKFGWSSKTSTGLDVKYGMFLNQQQGDDHYGDDSFYGPLQIQAKLFFRAKVFNTFTGKLKRDVSDPSLSWHEFELFDAFDPYSFQFGFADFYLWFDELMDSINASLFEKYTTYGDLYLRLVGSYYDDNLEEIFVCGPWVRISFSVLSGDGAIVDDVYVVGGQSVSEEGVLSIDSSSPYEEGELSHAEVGTGTSVSEAENNVIHVNGQGVVTSLSDLFDQISDIPPLIGKIFSFLPSWCLELFATAFGLCVVVLVWKVASG